MKSLVMFGMLAFASVVHAEPSAQRIYGGVGMDTTVLGRLGYEHRLATLSPRLSLSIPAEVQLPLLRPGGGDGELRAGLRTDLVLGRFLLGSTLMPFARITSNDIHRAVGVGADLELDPGVTFSRGSFGLELGLNRSVADHLHHTDAYRKETYMDVVDGWYEGSSATLRAGIRTAVRLGGAEWRLRAGKQSGQVPFYFELGAAISF
ncbi:MAG: hypothetical protein NT062_18435 [Proteobacteria bacterium]|nr:hypothetical protein [Pseudomonadota bacterium]